MIKISHVLLLFLFVNNVQAHPIDDQRDQTDQVIMLAQNEKTVPAPNDTLMDLTGPTETKGIASIDPMGIVDLGNEFPGMEGRQLRARIFTIEPGGVIAIHTHNQRPGYAYIISGRIIEHRNDNAKPIVRIPGQIAMEKSGITHWWENTFDDPVKALVVDIFTPD
ncbi:MAG: cupin domain-containing protein [Gammaproteobacteria bacterium]|nr:cupin domain-containing protein [Gammaproteobacteria bacterium]NIN61440.1 cupin domain-containing protein [Gammaproteobacteria bacterium]NIO61207.1 cupin domain-containing protein [Gammaproteobacteria bacterium]NIP48859.1 cupin domain-containing protein [Gammaproteobacteria bacterium]NIQ09313.1 cupin domain-containing protein [Gammaproteobacteria bacterium]